MKLYLDEINPKNTVEISETCIENPTLSEVHEALDKLDQKRHTLLSLEKENETLLVGGGPDKFIILNVSSKSRSLLREGNSKSFDTITLCVGGQNGDYPENMVIYPSQAKEILLAFVEDNHNQYNWVMD